MEPNAARFPFPLPPRTIGEQKAKVNSFLNGVNGSSEKQPFSRTSPRAKHGYSQETHESALA
jgi:hypothetical protein